MVKVVWSDLAIVDLRSIHSYIAKDSKVYADKFISKIIGRVEQLAEFPKSGRVVPEFDNQSIHELIEGNYRIVYKVDSETVGIVRVHHSARQMKLPK